MPRSSLEKFRLRMALTAYFREMFGFESPIDSEAISDYYDELENQSEGYDTEGRSHVFKFLKWKTKDQESISVEDLSRYDRNIKQHLEDINQHREDQIIFKPFQMLAAFTTEAYLDWGSNRSDELLARLNEFVDDWNEKEAGRIKFPNFDESDLNKIALWMATGSGKTLLMHLNYYQYLHYAEEGDLQQPENILLVTTNEGLSKQHIEEMRKSGVPCRRFNAETVSLKGVGRNPVKVIEIHKLKEQKEGEGLSVGVDSLEGKNLVFVDEGHTGASSSTQSWRKRRESIAEEGFTFEYSATFGQAIAGSGTDIEEEYGKSILVDYSYPRFYDDGYGKDYEILNLENDIQNDLREQYLLANLLTFYEQVFVYEKNKEQFQEKYNIFQPLLVFIGHTVNAGKTQSNLSTNDERSLSDVEDLLLFIDRVVRNENNWVPEAIENLLSGDSAVMDKDIFYDSFSALINEGIDAHEIFENLLQHVFNVNSSSNLEVVNIKASKGEIGLRATAADEYFGVINIGNDKVFLDRLESHSIDVTEDSVTESLFDKINNRDTNVDILLGSKKFIEGWDSWRVSTMGLMNFGRGEGPQVIQLFGRGVRLLGKNRTLKRSSELEGRHPDYLPKLETLNIFGVRADYMANFRDYLSDEGIDTKPTRKVSIDTRVDENFKDSELLTIRKRDINTSFTKSKNLRLEASNRIEPEINLGRVSSLSSQHEDIEELEQQVSLLPEGTVSLLDWNKIYRELWNFREENEMTNLIVEKPVLKKILSDHLYTLHCPEELVRVEEPKDLQRLTDIALVILRAYIANFYSREKRRWEEQQLTYRPIEAEIGNGNILEEYEATISNDATEYIAKLKQKLAEEDLYETDEGIPNRVHIAEHVYLPLLLQESNQYSEDVAFSPPGLNEGEEELIEELSTYINSIQGRDITEKYEIFLLRNQSRGTGIGFLAGEKGNDKYYPDFVMWLKSEDEQHIIFLEPHGLRHEGEPLESHRVQFHKDIKRLEQQLQDQSEKSLYLHSYVISQTPVATLKQHSRTDEKQAFHEAGIYFQSDEIDNILQDVLADT